MLPWKRPTRANSGYTRWFVGGNNASLKYQLKPCCKFLALILCNWQKQEQEVVNNASDFSPKPLLKAIKHSIYMLFSFLVLKRVIFKKYWIDNFQHDNLFKLNHNTNLEWYMDLPTARYSNDLRLSTSVESSARRKWMVWLLRSGEPNTFLCLQYSAVDWIKLSNGWTATNTGVQYSCFN